MCDACAHTFISTADDCQPTHAASAFLGSRFVTTYGSKRQPAKSAPRLQCAADGGDSSFEEDSREHSGAFDESSEGMNSSGMKRKSGNDVSEKTGDSGLSEAAFYMSLGESDGGGGAAVNGHEAGDHPAAGKVDLDDSFDDVDGTYQPGQQLRQHQQRSHCATGILQHTVMLPPPRYYVKHAECDAFTFSCIHTHQRARRMLKCFNCGMEV